MPEIPDRVLIVSNENTRNTLEIKQHQASLLLTIISPGKMPIQLFFTEPQVKRLIQRTQRYMRDAKYFGREDN
jgi:hypothetical protein